MSLNLRLLLNSKERRPNFAQTLVCRPCPSPAQLISVTLEELLAIFTSVLGRSPFLLVVSHHDVAVRGSKKLE